MPGYSGAYNFNGAGATNETRLMNEDLIGVDALHIDVKSVNLCAQVSMESEGNAQKVSR